MVISLLKARFRCRHAEGWHLAPHPFAHGWTVWACDGCGETMSLGPQEFRSGGEGNSWIRCAHGD